MVCYSYLPFSSENRKYWIQLRELNWLDRSLTPRILRQICRQRLTGTSAFLTSIVYIKTLALPNCSIARRYAGLPVLGHGTLVLGRLMIQHGQSPLSNRAVLAHNFWGAGPLEGVECRAPENCVDVQNRIQWKSAQRDANTARWL